MSGTTLERDVCSRLASYIEARRSDIVASVVRSTVASQPGAPSSSAFVDGFLDRLCQELEVGDGDAVDVWIDGQTASSYVSDFARLVDATCTTIAAKYTSECGDPGGVVSYFVARSAELEKRFGVERMVRVRDSFDPSRFESRTDAVAALLTAIDARDPATCDHSRAVGMWCGRLAKMLSLSPEEQTFAMLSGTLHDIGKITTPTDILRKSSQLEGEEWEMMRTHARIGARLLSRIPSLADVAPIVRWHHERIDGRGYPDRLAGDDIPQIARIVSVANAFHAMISKRPYRKPMPVLFALDELRAGAGSQWDGEVVGAMLAIVQPAGAVRRQRTLRTATSA